MDGFAVLADPTRRTIVELLVDDEKDAGSLASEFDMSQPAVSRHLKVLREAGIVEARVEAQRRIYSLTPGGLSDVVGWVDRYRAFWNDRLDALERTIAEGETP